MKKTTAHRLSIEQNTSAKISSISSEAIVIPAGAQGAVVVAQSENYPVRNASGNGLGGSSDTSLVITSTAFTQEVGYDTADADLANGEYWVDYLTGEIRGKKDDASISMTVDYKIAISNTAILEFLTRLDEVNDAIATYFAPFNFATISTATTTTVLSGTGRVRRISVAGGTLGDVTIYDNTAASGTVIQAAATPVSGAVLIEDISVATGLTIVTAAATVLNISYLAE